MKIELRPCPFCGESANLGKANWTGIPKVECVNFGKWIDGVWHRELGCMVRPSTYKGTEVTSGIHAGKTEEQIIIDVCNWWNAATTKPKHETGDEMTNETQTIIQQAAWALVTAAENGDVKGWKKQDAIAFLRAITAEFGDLADPSWKERADKLEGGK